MATESAFVWDESYTAAADLSANQFYAVKLSADHTVNLCTAATDRAIGILQNKPKTAYAIWSSDWSSDVCSSDLNSSLDFL